MATVPGIDDRTLAIDRCFLVSGKTLPLHKDGGLGAVEQWEWGFDYPLAVAFRYSETQAWWVTPIARNNPGQRLPIWNISAKLVKPIRREEAKKIVIRQKNEFNSELTSLLISRNKFHDGTLTLMVANRQYAVGEFKLIDCVSP